MEWYSTTLSSEKTKRILQSIVLNVTLYGAQVWTMTTTVRNKIRTVELDLIRICLQITRDDRMRTEDTWNTMGVECSITKVGQLCSGTGMPEKCHSTAGRNEYSTGTSVRRTRERLALRWKTYLGNAMIDRDLREGDWDDGVQWRTRTVNSW